MIRSLTRSAAAAKSMTNALDIQQPLQQMNTNDRYDRAKQLLLELKKPVPRQPGLHIGIVNHTERPDKIPTA